VEGGGVKRYLHVQHDVLHLLAVARLAVGAQAARRRVHQQREVQLDRLLPLLALLVGHLPLRPARVHGPQRVAVQLPLLVLPARAEALLAEVHLARVAPEAVSDQDVLLAVLARRDELGRVRVVQVVEDHHAGVLGAAELVELVVVALYAI